MESGFEILPVSDRVQDIASVVTREVQRSFARLIGAMPGRVVRPAHLQKGLEIDAKIAWQVFKVAKAEDPLEAVQYVPSMVSLKRVFIAAQKKGIPADVLDAMRGAVENYDLAGKEHADGRASFASMIASLRNDESSAAVVQQQARAAFRENCQLWGAQIGVAFHQMIVRREPDGELAAVATSIKSDIRKLRAGVEPVLFSYSSRNEVGVLAPAARAAIDSEAYAAYGIPLLPQFCTAPIPTFGTAEMKDGWTVHRMIGCQIGKQSSINLATSQRFSNRLSDLVTMSNGKKMSFTSTACRVPTETMILELLVHRPTYGIVQPKFRFIPEMGVDFIAELERPEPQLPNFASVQSFGPLNTAPPVSEVREYNPMCTYVLNKLGWRQAEMDVYRVTVSYPILHSLAVLWFETPDLL